MASSSLLDNPVQAILYLRELTTIVQNQQSLIQTQRARIEELDRRVDELMGENIHLRETRVHQQHHYHHHPDPGYLHHHHPEPQLNTGGSLPDHAPRPVQVETAPLQPSQSQPADPGDMQLVPANPSTFSAADSDQEDGRSSPGCRSLMPMTPNTICRSLALARKSESQTVLHQFCCPAPENPEADTTGSSSGQMLSLEDDTSSRKEVEGTGGGIKREGPSEYEISLENKNKQIEELEQKYGGHLIARRAARRIQTAFRQYQLSKNFQKIRNSLSESKLPRRISLRRHGPAGRAQNPAQRHSYTLLERGGAGQIPLRSKTPPPPPSRSTSLPQSPAAAPTKSPGPAPTPASSPAPSSTLTQLEDCFSEQLHSLAQSIDDALRGWTMTEGGEATGLLLDPGVFQAAAESMPRSASSLLMAFRDVTVHIDSNSSYTISSATATASTTTTLGSAGGGAEAGSRKPSVSGGAGRGARGSQAEDGVEADFPAPPPSEELEVGDPGSRRGSAVAAPGGGGGVERETGSERLVSTSTSGQSNQQPVHTYTQYHQYQCTQPPQVPGGHSAEALQALVLSLPRDRCQDPASCRSPTLSTDTHRKRLYRIGLNLFNV